MSSEEIKSFDIDDGSNVTLKTLEKNIEFKKSSAGIGIRVHSVSYNTSYICCPQGV